MDWTRAIDGYCERTDPSFWAEPVIAVTNVAFLIAAWIMWRRVRGQGLPLAVWMVVILAAIGVGSYLFHTYAQVWAERTYFDFKVVIPCHYRTFPILAQSAEPLVAALPGVDVRTPEVMDVLEL